jgi:hypothetical protein
VFRYFDTRVNYNSNQGFKANASKAGDVFAAAGVFGVFAYCQFRVIYASLKTVILWHPAQQANEGHSDRGR